MKEKYTTRVELHCHSKYSEMDGVASPKEILDYADWHGIPAVAITDHGGVLAFPEMDEEQERGKHFARPIYGMEAYVVDDVTQILSGASPIYHLTILIQNEVGRKNLYRLITESDELRKKSKRRIPLSHLLAAREGLLLGSACEAGRLFMAAKSGASDEELKEIAGIYDFIELQPDGNNIFLFEADVPEITNIGQLHEVNRRIIAIADELGIPVVATSDAHYLEKEDKLAREVLHHYLGYAPDTTTDLHFRTTEEILSEFAYLGEEKAYEIVIGNTNRIAEECRLDRALNPKKAYPVSTEADLQKLKAICLDAIPQKYDTEELRQEALSRVNWELTAIQNTGMAFLFHMIRDILKENGLRDCDISLRGAAGSSEVAYLCGISGVDPIRHHLSPEFAFGIDQNKEIDIDINVPASKHAAVLRSVEKMKGLSSAYRAGCVGTVSEGKAEGMILLYEDDFDIREGVIDHDRVRSQLTGIFSSEDVHPGGMICIPEDVDIFDYTPYTVTEDGSKRTYFDYHDLWKQLFKVDLLAHDTPERLMRLAEITGVDLASIPMEDDKVLSLFIVDEETGEASGCRDLPEFRKEFCQKVLEAVKPTSFEDLVKLLGLYHGANTWTDNAERLIADGMITGTITAGSTAKEILGCREDVFDYCLSIGIDRSTAYRIAEDVRMGRVNSGRSKNWLEWEQLLLEHGAPDRIIWSMQQIRYMFPRAHAVSYMQMTWKLAWFKIYYPEEYEAETKAYYESLDEEQER